MHRRLTFRLAFATLLALPLAACHGNKPASAGVIASDDPDAPRQPLPHPQSDGRGVTGMPDARTQPAAVDPATADTASAPSVIDPPPALASDDVAPAPTPAADSDAKSAVIGDGAEPTVDDAVRVVRDYYDAINRGAYDRAYALWSDRGAASGKSLQQFSDGFADTARDSIDIQRPPSSAIEGAAGSLYLEIPLRIVATRRDQSSTTYIGSYVLRRSMVDGSSAEQRKWRIQSAHLQQGN